MLQANSSHGTPVSACSWPLCVKGWRSGESPERAVALRQPSASTTTEVQDARHCRRAIEQRPLPFNLSVVSDFMRSRDKYWKDRVGAAHITFAQICRRFESEASLCLSARSNQDPVARLSALTGQL